MKTATLNHWALEAKTDNRTIRQLFAELTTANTRSLFPALELGLRFFSGILLAGGG